jgi:hypothetical protein
MGRRFVKDRMNKAIPGKYVLMWSGPGVGRFWKRQLSKSRRRAWKQYGIEGKPITCYENECNYKNW